jgi:hypothetical protein
MFARTKARIGDLAAASVNRGAAGLLHSVAQCIHLTWHIFTRTLGHSLKRLISVSALSDRWQTSNALALELAIVPTRVQHLC